MGLGKIPFERNGPAVARRRLVRPCELLEYVAPIEMSERVPAVHREGPVVALERGLPAFERLKSETAVVERITVLACRMSV